MKKNIFFIAEMSANHCGNLNHALKLIQTAKINGADAVKIQTYTAESMTLNIKKKYFKINKGIWKGKYLWDLYDKGKTPLVWHKKLFNYAKKIGIKIFSTPFDDKAVDFLEKLNCPIYKISSFEMTDLLLIKKVAMTKKPIIISTGMANVKEIDEAYFTAKKYGAKKITLLYCVSNYPSKNSDFNLNNIKFLKKRYKCKIGLSDHSKDNRIAMAAVAAGVEVVEKHIALEGQKKGLDINFSLKGKEIKNFRNDLDLISDLFSKNFIDNKRNDFDSRKYRRSIFAIKNIMEGEKFTLENIKRIRPGYGLEPKYFNKLLKTNSPYNIEYGEPLSKDILKKLKL
jgi:pseudaminic acid synthase